MALEGIDAGCTSWCWAIGGVLPGFSVAFARARREGDDARVAKLNDLAEPLWELMRRYGESRVAAAIATEMGLTQRDALAKPLLPLEMRPRARALEAARAMLGASQSLLAGPMARLDGGYITPVHSGFLWRALSCLRRRARRAGRSVRVPVLPVASM